MRSLGIPISPKNFTLPHPASVNLRNDYDPMKPKNQFLFASLITVALATGAAHAADGTWNSTSSGTWNSATSPPWDGSVIADGSGSTAFFNTVNPTADVTVTLGGNRTIGNLSFGDTNTATAAGWLVTGDTLTLAGGTPTITVGALGAGKAATISSILAGSSGLAKAGSGFLRLTATNTYSGGTTLSAGTLQIENTGALGSGTLTLGAGTTFITALSGTVSNAIALSGAGTQTLVGGSSTNPTLTGGITSDGSTGALVIDGSTWNLIHNLTFSNATLSLGAKSLFVQGSSGNGASGASQQKTILTNSTLTTSGDVQVGRASLVIGGTSSATIGGQLKGVATTGDWGFVTLQDSAVVTATGGVDNAGLAAWALNLNGGTLNTPYIRGSDSNIGGNPTRVTFNGTQVVATASDATFVRVSNGSSAYIGNGGALLDSGTHSIGIGIILANAPSSTGFLTKSGTGTLTLSGANTYTGATTISNGTLSVGSIGNGAVAGNLGQATAAATNIVFDGGTLKYTGANATSNRAFTINNGKTATIDTANDISFDGATGAATTGALTKIGAGKLTLTGTNTYTGNTTVSAGTLALTGTGSIANSSAITINSSTTLSVTGLTGGFTLGAGQSLGGSGTLLATAKNVIANGTLSPGNSPGTLIQDGGNLQLGADGDLNWQVYDAGGAAGTGYDTVSLINGATLDLSLLSEANPYNINLWSLSGIGPDVNGNAIFDNTLNYSWTIFSTGSTISGFSADLFDINVGAFNGTTGFSNTLNGTFGVALGDSDTDLILTYTAIPEPSAALLGSLGMLCLLRRRR